MRITRLALLAVVLAACGDDGNTRSDAGHDAYIVDAPEFSPVITGLAASPNPITTPGVATPVTFTWAYLVEPTYPDPTCTLDNGVGQVMRGVPVNITISQLTVFTLTCSNRAGQGSRQVVVNVPPAAPQLATFTVSPTSVTAGVATPLTFSWTYANTPNPPPTCSIDGGTTTITSGTPVTPTPALTQARTFRLRCTNTSGTVYSGSTVADVTVAANECGTAYAQCDAHATCTDTLNGYTCACSGPTYTGNGDTCSFVLATGDCSTTATLCDQNAQCVGTTTCACKAGYVGSGAPGDCTKLKTTFVTAAVGSGQLSTWASAGGATGLAAADAICVAAATNASPPLPNPTNYVAWMSDSQHDAFCRVQGLGLGAGAPMTTKGNNCGLGALTSAAGPWVRVGDYKPVFSTLDKLVAPNSVTYYAADRNENGAEITSTADRVWTGTDNAGQYVANATCNDWLGTTGYSGAAGEVHGGGSSWTQTGATNTACTTNTYHIRCIEKSTGPALPPRHPTNVKKAFITSVSGNGLLSSWPDSYGQTSYTAADAICQARARYAGFVNPASFKAWFAYPSYISGHITQTTFPYARPDGVILGNSRDLMLINGSGVKLQAAWNETELGTYLAGNADSGNVITDVNTSSGTTGQYSTSSICYSSGVFTTNSNFYSAYYGRYDFLDARAYNTLSTVTCDQTTMRFYCVED